MVGFESWESYFYPHPNAGTLRNLPGILDPNELTQFEYTAVAARQRLLAMNPELVAGDFDAEHVRALHRYLFQDVYEWAGEYRTQNISKGMAARDFADVNSGEIDLYLADVYQRATSIDWAHLDHAEFAGAAAVVFALLNQAHPFREGNGRMSKVFMSQLAERSRFRLDYTRVSPEAWNNAAELSRPDRGSYKVVPDMLVPVFRHLALPRD